VRIDVHNHAVPQQAIDLLNRDPVYGVSVSAGRWRGGPHPDFDLLDSFVDPDAKVAELEERELEGAVVSTSPTLFYHHVGPEPGEAMARAVNAGLAEFAGARPDRLSWMASVPLQAPDRAVAVLGDAVAAGCVGVEIATAAGPEQPLDDPALEPFWAAAERHGLPVMLHPSYTVAHPRLDDYYLENVVGFPLETTIAAERLICSGTLDRHPRLRLVLVHAGGYLPWQAGRLRHARTVRPELEGSPADPWSYLGQIVVDPITHDPDALRYLIAKVGAANIVMGTDLPFDMATPRPMTALLEACDAEIAARIAERNPAELYGLVAASSTGPGQAPAGPARRARTAGRPAAAERSQ
jgi:aminocarboxymuconate-semialdehyde decarboxylase